MNRHILAVFACLFAVLAIASVAVASSGNHGSPVQAVSVHHSPRVCRSAKTWGPAPDAKRPCARVIAVEEDGSVQIEVSDADGTVRYTTGIGALDR